MTRFDLDMDGSMEPSENGRWVRYEDVVQREWQGLTQQEQASVLASVPTVPFEGDWHLVLLTAIEAKLREKNAQPSKPLTLGQKQRLWSSLGSKPTLKDRVNAFGLAIEAAHGIKEKNT